jgi:hypothetical protein
MSILLDTSQWPFVFTKFDGDQSPDELDAYIERIDEVHARRQLYVGVSFLKRYTSDRKAIARVGRWLKEAEEVQRRYCVAVGMINLSGGFRFVLGAIFLLKPMPCPYHVTKSFDEAVDFVREQALRRRLALPPVKRPWTDLP